jgi:PadR family transcriptional regulator PadR
MERRDWIKAEWGLSELGRNAKFYALTRAGRTRLVRETEHWRTVAGAVEKVLRTDHA